MGVLHVEEAERRCGAIVRTGGTPVVLFYAFITKRGWRDEQSDDIRQRKITVGLGHRDDLQTCFDIHDADEGRK